MSIRRDRSGRAGAYQRDNYVPDVQVELPYRADAVPRPEERQANHGVDQGLYWKRIAEEYDSLDEFLKVWNAAERKQAVVEELSEHGVLFDALAEVVGKELDAFDLICHVAFDQPPLTRRERAEQVKKRGYFAQYGQQARAVLEALLDKYSDEGLASIEDTKVLRVQPFSELGTPVELVRAFGGRKQYEQAIRELEAELYPAA